VQLFLRCTQSRHRCRCVRDDVRLRGTRDVAMGFSAPSPTHANRVLQPVAKSADSRFPLGDRCSKLL
jgi:hypothetical protein